MMDCCSSTTGVVVVVVLVLVFAYMGGYIKLPGRDAFSPIYLDQMAMKASDPMYFKYSSWERDIAGMSPRDYYLENETNYLNQVAPGYFEGDALYVDQTNYMGMPPDARPLPNRPPIDSLEEAQLFDSELASTYYNRPVPLVPKPVDAPAAPRVAPTPAGVPAPTAATMAPLNSANSTKPSSTSASQLLVAK